MTHRLPDIFVLIGLALLAVGLWIVGPWLALSVIGLIVLVAGLALGKQMRLEARPKDDSA